MKFKLKFGRSKNMLKTYIWVKLTHWRVKWVPHYFLGWKMEGYPIKNMQKPQNNTIGPDPLIWLSWKVTLSTAT